MCLLRIGASFSFTFSYPASLIGPGEAGGVSILLVFNQGIAALRAEKFLNCQIHVVIIVADHDQIV